MNRSDIDNGLRRLSSNFLGQCISQHEFRREIARLLKQHFSCERANLWRITAGENGRKLARVSTSDPSSHELEDAPVLTEGECPEYFAKISSGGAYICTNSPFVPERLARTLFSAPGGTLLSTVVSVNGCAYGVISCERFPGQSAWTSKDVQMLRRLAATVSLVTRQHEREKAAVDPSLSERPRSGRARQAARFGLSNASARRTWTSCRHACGQPDRSPS
jgi:GAF domain-containing protein